MEVEQLERYGGVFVMGAVSRGSFAKGFVHNEKFYRIGDVAKMVWK